ncbi:O-antigen ligase family protein [uncultured Maribacter sp.]|uniref:O-antigen ligase family protein n=1 Tax=uncultured Maribacter sp. TaxID=431308 RepID=UPI00260D8FAA|nr:O-antigen ligase family protein [uncultured Maribacter sp.]
MPDFKTFVIIVFKYFIIIWGGYEVMKKTSSNEMGIFMLIGALSILANTFLFENPKGDNGRYSGFYIDPNNAGLICSIGFALSFVFRKSLRIISKTTFTLLGILTFSRTFIVSWLLLNIVSIKLDIKNAKMIGIGFFLLSSLLIYNEFLPNKNVRLEQLGAMISGGDSSSSKGLQKDSRLDTWSRYFDALQDKPFFGNGYLAFGGNGVAPPVGVHNTYLMIMGESGIFTLLIFICYIIWLGIKCIKHFQEIPHVLMMLIALFLFLMTNHNFFTTDYSLLILVWIHTQVEKQEKDLTINLQTNAV